MNNFKSNIVWLFLFLIFCSATSAQLTYPTRFPTAVIPHTNDGHRLFFLYMPMQYDDNVGQDTFKLYYIKASVPVRYYLARSINYGVTWTDTQAVTVPSHESIIKIPIHRNFIWVLINGQVKFLS